MTRETIERWFRDNYGDPDDPVNRRAFEVAMRLADLTQGEGAWPDRVLITFGETSPDSFAILVPWRTLLSGCGGLAAAKKALTERGYIGIGYERFPVAHVFERKPSLEARL